MSNKTPRHKVRLYSVGRYGVDVLTPSRDRFGPLSHSWGSSCNTKTKLHRLIYNSRGYDALKLVRVSHRQLIAIRERAYRP